MKHYVLKNGLDGVSCVVVYRGNNGVRLRLVGSLLEYNDPHQFKGSPAQLLALSILAEFMDADEEATLHGRTLAWKWHRLFAEDVLAQAWPEAFMRTTITTDQVLRFIASRNAPIAQASLFETEEPCQQDAR